jgi:hypothetical protein
MMVSNASFSIILMHIYDASGVTLLVSVDPHVLATVS